MSNENRGQSAAPGEAHVLVIDGDGVAYGVPLKVMERHRLPSDRRAQIDARTPGDGAGTDGATIPASDPLYQLPSEVIAPFRLSDEERAAAGSRRNDDMRGYGQFIGVFPGWVAVAPPVNGAAARRSHITTYDSAFWFNSGGGSSRYGPYPGLR